MRVHMHTVIVSRERETDTAVELAVLIDLDPTSSLHLQNKKQFSFGLKEIIAVV